MLTVLRSPVFYLLLVLIGCTGLFKTSSAPKTSAVPSQTKPSGTTGTPSPTPPTGTASTPGQTPPTETTAATAQPAQKPSETKGFPCNPIYVSGITGECAGTGDPKGTVGEAYKAGSSQHPLALEESNLPKDRFGLIDWADSIKAGNVKPLHSFNPQDPDQPQIDMDVVIFTKSRFQPDVIFPHKVHTMWLTCTNCHPAIFPMSAKVANQAMTMPEIASGKFCGVCHNRVAFPLEDCLRCHVKPRDVPPIDPDAEKWGIQPIKPPEP